MYINLKNGFMVETLHEMSPGRARQWCARVWLNDCPGGLEREFLNRRKPDWWDMGHVHIGDVLEFGCGRSTARQKERLYFKVDDVLGQSIELSACGRLDAPRWVPGLGNPTPWKAPSVRRSRYGSSKEKEDVLPAGFLAVDSGKIFLGDPSFIDDPYLKTKHPATDKDPLGALKFDGTTRAYELTDGVEGLGVAVNIEGNSVKVTKILDKEGKISKIILEVEHA